MSEEHAESRMAQLWTFLKSAGDLGSGFKTHGAKCTILRDTTTCARQEDLLGGRGFGYCPEYQVRELPEDALCEHRVVQGGGHCCTTLVHSLQKCLS